MRSAITALVGAGLIAATLSACDSHNAAPPGANPRQVTVVGSGQVQGVPDTLTADVSIEFTAPDVTAAMNQTSHANRPSSTRWSARGCRPQDIGTTQVTLEPQYNRPEPNGTAAITAYRATNGISLKIHPDRHRIQAVGPRRHHRR